MECDLSQSEHVEVRSVPSVSHKNFIFFCHKAEFKMCEMIRNPQVPPKLDAGSQPYRPPTTLAVLFHPLTFDPRSRAASCVMIIS